MTYAAAIDQLNAMAPELFTTPGHTRRKFSVEEIGTLLKDLGDPHRTFRSVLIAGTNGKGSTAATLASILSAAGLRVGLYTSPHLERVNERIRIAGVEISDDDFARQFFRVREASDRLVKQGTLAQMPSFFEIVTAMAFLEFAQAPIDIAVLEVGMGGRLDATNIVDPLLSIITDISLDHTEWLGPTISAIAREKAGILRRGGTMITLPQHPEANQVLGEVATELGVRAVSAVPYMSMGPSQETYVAEAMGAEVAAPYSLLGEHQHRNIALAVAAAVELAQQHGFPITPQNIAEGIRSTKWPGRLEVLRAGERTWILDVAHNPAGAWALRSGLRNFFDAQPDAPRTLVFSCLRDKPIPEMAQILFPLFDRVIFAPIASPRAASTADLLHAAEKTGVATIPADSIGEALDAARQQTAKGIVVISGSVYLVGDARRILRESLQAAGSRK